ncbi:C48 family peptidase [Sansalvadorimonas sp. 2012CJ34-2]|uniref:C48 family peptidase n=1 Tax=Parendozoicomonas callyspongiae TaxID=2942213 RepID=A0ABT0PB09_9GAMM|nr:Ulp1 family isopeptidase [Sansalvadorimonas sp. 2012CJ34-2]MCL6268569.1 C48 family peptidase [Sansalvadorimonas sp. 2012CJ34-2]
MERTSDSVSQTDQQKSYQSQPELTVPHSPPHVFGSTVSINQGASLLTTDSTTGTTGDTSLSRKRPLRTSVKTSEHKRPKECIQIDPSDASCSISNIVLPAPGINFDFLFNDQLELNQQRLDFITSALDRKEECKLVCNGSTLYSECPIEDILNLKKGVELTDSLLLLSMSLCEKRQEYYSLQPKNIYLSPFLYTGHIEIEPQRSKKKPIQLEGVGKIFLPVNVDNCHWILLVADITKEKIYYLDSLLSKPAPSQGPLTSDLEKILLRDLDHALGNEQQDTPTGILQARLFHKWLETKNNTTGCSKDFSRFTIENLETPPQNAGTNDCGVAVIWAIDRLSLHGGTNLKITSDYPYHRTRTNIFNSLIYFCDLEITLKALEPPPAEVIDLTETTPEKPIVISD